MNSLIFEKGWEILEKEGLAGLNLTRLSCYCNKPELEISAYCSTPLSILMILIHTVQEHSSLEEPFPENSHDFLFESIISVLETLNPYRRAMKRLMNDLTLSPCLVKDIIPFSLKWSRNTLSLAGIKATGMSNTFNTYFLSSFCLYILLIWNKDNTPDLAVTLAKLDQGLTKLERYFIKN